MSDTGSADPPARIWSNPLSALVSVFSSDERRGGEVAPGTGAPSVPSSPSPSPPASAPSALAEREFSFGDRGDTACESAAREFVLEDLLDLHVCIVSPGLAGSGQLTFLSPDGNVYQKMTLAFGAAQIRATLPVAGTHITQHTLSGRWTAKISLNGQPVSEDTFALLPRP